MFRSVKRAPNEMWPLSCAAARAYRRASDRNLCRLLVLVVAVLAFLATVTQAVAMAMIPQARAAVVVGVFVILGAGVVWLNVALTRDCKLLGALCPRCGRQLIGPGHTVSVWRKIDGRLRGQCPSCFVHLEEEPPSAS